MHTGRIIIYTILISGVAVMGYVGLRIGVARLWILALAGIVFLIYKFFAKINE